LLAKRVSVFCVFSAYIDFIRIGVVVANDLGGEVVFLCGPIISPGRSTFDLDPANSGSHSVSSDPDCRTSWSFEHLSSYSACN
jgi:hypothetical protein